MPRIVWQLFESLREKSRSSTALSAHPANSSAGAVAPTLTPFGRSVMTPSGRSGTPVTPMRPTPTPASMQTPTAPVFQPTSTPTPSGYQTPAPNPSILPFFNAPTPTSTVGPIPLPTMVYSATTPTPYSADTSVIPTPPTPSTSAVSGASAVSSAALTSFSVSVQFCELFCGEVLDLLTPSQADLRVETGPLGAQVRNLTRAHVRDEQDFLRLLLQAVANRTQRQSVFGPVSTRAGTVGPNHATMLFAQSFHVLTLELLLCCSYLTWSGFFVLLDVVQSVGPRGDRISSRLQFVELPGLEKCASFTYHQLSYRYRVHAMISPNLHVWCHGVCDQAGRGCVAVASS